MNIQSNKNVMRSFVLLVSLLLTPALLALELVMVEQPGCFYCSAWKEEIAPIWSKTEAGQSTPLRHVDIRDAKHEIELARPVIFTPTFLFVEQGRELKRLEGYQSEDFFWLLSEEIIRDIATSM